MNAAATAPTAAGHDEGFRPVQMELLRRCECARVDLFVQEEAGSPPALYQLQGGVLDHSVLDRLAESGIHRLYVRTDDFQRFGADLLETIESLADRTIIPPAERFAALQSALASEIERTSQMFDCGQYVDLSKDLSRKLMSVFAGGKVLPMDLFRLARHDFNTFTHVTNVAAYSVVLAQRMGLASGDKLEHVAQGGMLHDIGKRFIPASILTKSAKLDAEERAVVQMHPQRGYEDLRQRADVTYEQLMMTYQHHERFDGLGYPVGLAGDEIHPWARMLAVVDVFDAMTGVRPYRRPVTAQAALDYLRRHAGTHFDPEVVKCWHAAMSGS